MFIFSPKLCTPACVQIVHPRPRRSSLHTLRKAEAQMEFWNMFPRKRLPSLKLTWHLKIDHWKRNFLLETTIFRGYVGFRECEFNESSKRPSILGFHCSLQGPSWWVLLLLGRWGKKRLGNFLVLTITRNPFWIQIYMGMDIWNISNLLFACFEFTYW